jgi:agmatinase
MQQRSAAEYLSHGQIPFFRLPVAPLAAGPLPLSARAAILGVPWDGGSTYRPGARLAPWEVRRVSALVQGHHPGLDVDPFECLAAVDAGNVVFPPFDPGAVREAIRGSVDSVLAQGAIPFLVGGDHSIALPALRAVAAHHGPIAVLHVDAHLDTSGPEVWGDAWHHGTPFRHALEERLALPGQLHQVGIRGPRGSARDGDLGAAHGARVHGADEIAERGIAAVVREIVDAVGDRPLYLSFDVDAVDPAFAPGTGTPVPGGLTSREALALVRGLAGVRLAGMDVVEVCPPYDHGDATSLLAAHLLFEGLAVASLRSSR